MKTQYFTATSLDGFIATEDDSLDWLFPLGDLAETAYPQFIAGVGALAMGANTYEWMRRHADAVTASAGSAWPYAQPTWVFTSRERPAIAGADLRFVRGDVRAVHAAMSAAAGAKNLWIVGGGDLAGQFHDAGLLDEILVQVGSVTLGRGKPLFPRRLTSPALQLLGVRQVGSGFAELRYAVPRTAPRGVALLPRTAVLLARITDATTRGRIESLFEQIPALPGPPVQESLERAQFAVIRLVLEGRMPIDAIVLLYRRDARDLWVNAGFADDARAHEAWWASLAPSAG